MTKGPEKIRRRLRLVDVSHASQQDGHCTVTVVMEWKGDSYRESVEGTETRQGVLRSAALACLKVANKAAEDPIDFSLSGVKAVRAFDSEVVIASVRGQSEEREYRLLGCSATGPGEDPARVATRAVLDALNRVLEKYVTPD